MVALQGFTLSAKRLIILGGALLYAVVAVGSGLDRASVNHPRILARIPESLSYFGAGVRAANALAAKDYPLAKRLSQAAIARAPIEATSAAGLGAAITNLSGTDAARAAMVVAGRQGWRVPFTQTYWLGEALEGNDVRRASLYLDALARQYPQILKSPIIMGNLEGTIEGQDALADRLAQSPNWQVAYAADLGGVNDETMMMRALVWSGLASRGVQVGCNAISPTVQRLVEINAAQAAAELWRGHCPHAGDAIVYDGNFAMTKVDQATSPFVWLVIGSADTLVMSEPDQGQKLSGLRVESSAAAARLVVRQAVFVEPGQYILRWHAFDGAEHPTQRLRAIVSCTPMPELNWLAAAYNPAQQMWEAVVTIDATCATPFLHFGITPGTGSTYLSGVSLSKAS